MKEIYIFTEAGRLGLNWTIERNFVKDRNMLDYFMVIPRLQSVQTWCRFISSIWKACGRLHVTFCFSVQRYDGSWVSRPWMSHTKRSIWDFQKVPICTENLRCTRRQQNDEHHAVGLQPLDGRPTASACHYCRAVPCPCGRVLADDSARHRRRWFFWCECSEWVMDV